MRSLRPLYAISAPTLDELAAFESLTQGISKAGRVEQHNGVTFRGVTIDDRLCLLFVSGMSVVNAAMTTQAALDRYPITHVILLGAAGGVNPALESGDVVIPENWANHNEAAYLNPGSGGGWEIPLGGVSGLANFGMIFPETVAVVRSGSGGPQLMPVFEADRGLVAAATKVASELSAPTSAFRSPKVVSRGNGVSGPAFVANRDYRVWLSQVWQAEVVDLESAAVAQVCWANRVPFVSVRAVTGLAGGGVPLTVPAEPPINNAARVVREMLRNLPN